MKEEASLSQLNKANIIIINNNSDDNNEIINNQEGNNSFSKSSPNLSIGHLKPILDISNSYLGTIKIIVHLDFFRIAQIV